jgi:hypothetical protein
MTPSGAGSLPLLDVADFGPGSDHLVAPFLGGKVLAIVHRTDPALPILPGLLLPPDDPYTYVFIHGGPDITRFENLAIATHEIPVEVVVALLLAQYGQALNGMRMRLCSCYGNLLRPGDTDTLAERLAAALSTTAIEAYHGLVILDATPPRVRLGRSVRWDATSIPPGPIIVGPPGDWEAVTP